jgi:UDP-N-acetylmuramoyl-L-alanyl-D-glutamate--2,6-diaminopimelate ligase
MKIKDILTGNYTILNALEKDVLEMDVNGISQDTRVAEKGDTLFVFNRIKVNAEDLLNDAVKKSPALIITENSISEDSKHFINENNIKTILVENPRTILAKAYSEKYNNKQPDFIAAVTGTNGKSSIVDILRQTWNYLGYDAASIGTVGLNINGEIKEESLSTPEPKDLYKFLHLLKEANINHCSMEATSIGMHQQRINEVKITVGAFTNLSRDHLDYHHTFDEYFNQKKQLFKKHIKDNGCAVLNTDVKEYEELKKICEARNLNIITYGYESADFKLINQKLTDQGQSIDIEIFGKPYEINLPLFGDFQAYNSLAAAALAYISQEHKNIEEIIKALENLKPIRGRLEYIGEKNGGKIFIDYAHTSDALEKTLATMKKHTQKKLISVFGCGGDRDKTKRKIMGSISSEIADITIITDDNPRTEDPKVIRNEILTGAPNAIEVKEGRREAIKKSVGMLTPGDILIIAGKGHEDYQILGETKHHFSDKEEILKLIK